MTTINIWYNFKSFIKWARGEIVLIIVWFFALFSMSFVPPSMEYVSYINFEVLAVLFCLMAVVSGFMKTGLFSILSGLLLSKSTSVKKMSLILTLLCFFSSMLITNDVALITFVPLAISLMAASSQKKLIFVIVMQTIAANIGSMLTPIGNPQNLYLYSFYTMNIGEFLKITAPFCVIGLILLILCLLCVKDTKLVGKTGAASRFVNRRLLILYAILFALSISVVLRFIDYRICFGITVVALFLFDRRIFTKIDYSLLAVFTAFFIFVGNLGNITAVKNLLSAFITGRELFTAIAASQIISNVPAAIMLSGFTQNVAPLLAGVNIGGQGTLIASLASLISFKLYARTSGAKTGRYFAVFTLYNILFLIVLVFFAFLFITETP